MRMISIIKAVGKTLADKLLTTINAVVTPIAAGFSAAAEFVGAGFPAVRSVVLAKFAALATVIVMTSSLSGCAGLNYAMEHYDGVEVVSFEYDNRTWRIFDKPEENRLMITAGWGDNISHSMVDGLTLGISNSDHPSTVYRDTALAYLSSQGRECKADNISLIIRPQWELEYSCSGE